jgi:hypothetical protein
MNSSEEVLLEFEKIFDVENTEDQIQKKLRKFGRKAADLAMDIEAALIYEILRRDPVGAIRAKARIAAFAGGYHVRVKKLLEDFFKK